MKKIYFIIFAVLFSACANTEVVKAEVEYGKLPPNVNKGTRTAVVKVSLDKKGMPYIDTDPVVVKEGQRVVWVGPTDMSIKFHAETLFGKEGLSTRDAVINLKIPKQNKWSDNERFKKYKYDVVVGDKVLDPIFIVRRGF